jgi:putative endonuclease
MKEPIVYIIANQKNGTLYTGVTSNLIQRIYQHKEGLVKGFSLRYGCKILVYYELCSTMDYAVLREKQIKAGSRAKKIKLIEALNPSWSDLYPSILS